MWEEEEEEEEEEEDVFLTEASVHFWSYVAQFFLE